RAASPTIRCRQDDHAGRHLLGERVEILGAVRFSLTWVRLVLEPTGAMTVAAILSGEVAGGTAVVVLSGENRESAILTRRFPH
ncbi:MAG: hypothetical protein OEW93_08205, partial [Candidatus Bathyarchaeota archaeon]|nr:hypothetical protein [Candidatus Bathyarchaeota archaeon]